MRRHGAESKYKTVLCQHWQAGECNFGDACHFAHGQEELRRPPPPPPNAPGAGFFHARSSSLGAGWEEGGDAYGGDAGWEEGEEGAWEGGDGGADYSQNPLYKTVLCQHWESGSCRRGAQCQFAHGEGELRARPVAADLRGREGHPKAKTINCRYWLSGFCKNGADCQFLHGPGKLAAQQRVPPGLPASQQPPPPQQQQHLFSPPRPHTVGGAGGWQASGGPGASGPGPRAGGGVVRVGQQAGGRAAGYGGTGPSHHPLYKSTLCRFWDSLGYCKHGDDCQFAHGPEELRAPALPPAAAPAPPPPPPPRPHHQPSGGGGWGPAGGGYEAAGSSRAAAYNPLYKTVICQHWEAGRVCRRGAECQFAHGYEELRVRGGGEYDGYAEMGGAVVGVPAAPWGDAAVAASSGAGSEAGAGAHPNSRYKTVLCEYWRASGTCRRGAECTYAHGREELRRLPSGAAGGASTAAAPAPPRGGAAGRAKRVLCRHWQESGSCKFGDRCHYAHGEGELRRPAGQQAAQAEQQEEAEEAEGEEQAGEQLEAGSPTAAAAAGGAEGGGAAAAAGQAGSEAGSKAGSSTEVAQAFDEGYKAGLEAAVAQLQKLGTGSPLPGRSPKSPAGPGAEAEERSLASPERTLASPVNGVTKEGGAGGADAAPAGPGEPAAGLNGRAEATGDELSEMLSMLCK